MGIVFIVCCAIVLLIAIDEGLPRNGEAPKIKMVNSEEEKMTKLERKAREAGLYVDSYSPGDGVTRYRFFGKPMDYFAGRGLFTALGKKEAETWLDGYVASTIAHHAMTGE